MVLNLDTVQHDIDQWLQNFVEVPHTALGGFPPCPFARSARLKKSYSVRLGIDPYFDLKNQAQWGMGTWEVIIYVYDQQQWNHDMFSASLHSANVEHLLPKDIIALEDHPSDVEIVNGVCMNQGTYALALVQTLSDLNHKAKLMNKQGFYDTWPEHYLQCLFQHRQDPRQ
jgi:hypothetical protein